MLHKDFAAYGATLARRQAGAGAGGRNAGNRHLDVALGFAHGNRDRIAHFVAAVALYIILRGLGAGGDAGQFVGSLVRKAVVQRIAHGNRGRITHFVAAVALYVILCGLGAGGRAGQFVGSLVRKAVVQRIAHGNRLCLAHYAAAVALHVILCRFGAGGITGQFVGSLVRKTVIVRVEIRLAAILAGAVLCAVCVGVAGAGALMAEYGVKRRRGISRRQGILIAGSVLTASIRPMVERAAGAGRNGRGDADVAALFRGILRASPLGVAKAGDEGQLVPVRSAFCALRLLRVERMALRGLISAAAAGRLVLLEIGRVGEKMAILVALRLDLFIHGTHPNIRAGAGQGDAVPGGIAVSGIILPIEEGVARVGRYIA